MAGFFNDTSGLDASADFGSTNSASADFARHNATNPKQFESGLIDRLFGKKTPAAGATPSPGAPMAPAQPDTPPAPTPAISSGHGLVGRVLRAASGPPSYDASGVALVPGTSLTPQQFAQQLLAANHAPTPAPFNEALSNGQPPQLPTPSAWPMPAKMPPQGGPAPPGGAAPWWNPQSWFGQKPPQAPQPGGYPAPPNPNGLPPVPQPPAAPGYHPSTYPPVTSMRPAPNPNPFARHNDMNLNGLPAMTDPRFPLMPSRGFFRGGDVHNFRRGGYPHLMMGLPERMSHGGGQEGFVPPDGQGDGRSDHVEARLSPGEFVMDAETVALLGNGDNSAGARKLEEMRQDIRRQKGKALAKGHFSADAKEPEAYLKGGK